jgi:hypothetical protein
MSNAGKPQRHSRFDELVERFHQALDEGPWPGNVNAFPPGGGKGFKNPTGMTGAQALSGHVDPSHWRMWGQSVPVYQTPLDGGEVAVSSQLIHCHRSPPTTWTIMVVIDMYPQPGESGEQDFTISYTVGVGTAQITVIKQFLGVGAPYAQIVDQQIFPAEQINVVASWLPTINEPFPIVGPPPPVPPFLVNFTALAAPRVV